MATFPNYANILIDSYSVNRESALLRSEMESGPPKQAKIKSRVMVTHNVKIYISSKTDYQSFQTWYANDISQGADWFDFVDPISGSTIQARFVGGELTSSPMTAALEQWTISAKLESWSA